MAAVTGTLITTCPLFHKRESVLYLKEMGMLLNISFVFRKWNINPSVGTKKSIEMSYKHKYKAEGWNVLQLTFS